MNRTLTDLQKVCSSSYWMLPIAATLLALTSGAIGTACADGGGCEKLLERGSFDTSHSDVETAHLERLKTFVRESQASTARELEAEAGRLGFSIVGVFGFGAGSQSTTEKFKTWKRDFLSQTTHSIATKGRSRTAVSRASEALLSAYIRCKQLESATGRFVKWVVHEGSTNTVVVSMRYSASHPGDGGMKIKNLQVQGNPTDVAGFDALRGATLKYGRIRQFSFTVVPGKVYRIVVETDRDDWTHTLRGAEEQPPPPPPPPPPHFSLVGEWIGEGYWLNKEGGEENGKHFHSRIRFRERGDSREVVAEVFNGQRWQTYVAVDMGRLHKFDPKDGKPGFPVALPRDTRSFVVARYDPPTEDTHRTTALMVTQAADDTMRGYFLKLLEVRRPSRPTGELIDHLVAPVIVGAITWTRVQPK